MSSVNFSFLYLYIYIYCPVCHVTFYLFWRWAIILFLIFTTEGYVTYRDKMYNIFMVTWMGGVRYKVLIHQ